MLDTEELEPDMIEHHFIAWTQQNKLDRTPRVALKFAHLHAGLVPEQRELVFKTYLNALRAYVTEVVNAHD